MDAANPRTIRHAGTPFAYDATRGIKLQFVHFNPNCGMLTNRGPPVDAITAGTKTRARISAKEVVRRRQALRQASAPQPILSSKPLSEARSTRPTSFLVSRYIMASAKAWPTTAISAHTRSRSSLHPPARARS